MPTTFGREPPTTTRRRFGWALAAIALFAPLAACGPSETAQRQAFIAFLKGRIVEKPGIHLPVPTDDERASFGPYAAQFDVIAAYNHGLDTASAQALGGFRALAASGHTVGDLMGKKGDIAKVRDGLDAFAAAVKSRLAAADAARAAFPQADDLKAVYAAAYERDVSAPAALWLEATPILKDTMGSLLDVIAFVERHKDAISVSGARVSASDPKLLPQLQTLMAAMNDNVAKAAAQDKKMRGMVDEE